LYQKTVRKIIILIGCLFVLTLHYVKAFDDGDVKSTLHEWQLGGIMDRGRIFNHTPLITPINERPSIGGEIFLSKQTYGAHRWNSFFNYPEYGLCYTFLNLGSPDYAGTAHCLFPYMNFHLLNNNSPVNIHLRIGAGLAYVEKVYDAELNPLNLAFSTHFNVMLNAQLRGVCKLSNEWMLFAGAGINHLSNGAYQMPNLGLNVIGLFAGISHSFGKENRLITPVNKINTKNKNWDCSAYLLGGVKEINPIGGHKYVAGDFNLELTKRHLQYTRFGISLDVTYDGSEYDCIVFQSLPAVDRLKTMRVGVSGGYILLFGDFSLDLFLGTYLHEVNALYGKIYQRTSLRYSLSDRVKLSVSFRNHKGKADFIGIGLGYRFTR